MTTTGRLAMLFRAKTSRVLDHAKDPQETLDDSYQKQLELLQHVRRGVADAATSCKPLELQAEQLALSAETLQQQASQALSAGREDLAHEALTRRSAALDQLADLGRQHASLQAQGAKLTLSEEMADVGVAMQRAEDKGAQLQARAGAIDELLASGALDDASEPAQDPNQTELDRMSAHSDVEIEMARLKAALPAGGAPAAIAAGQQGSPIDRAPQSEPMSDPFQSAENQP